MTTEVITIISLITVRLVIPLLITLGIGLALSRWDERNAD